MLLESVLFLFLASFFLYFSSSFSIFIHFSCSPDTGSQSFQRSSIWALSWRTKSKTWKTSWLLRAMRGRVSSLTLTVCKWIGCRTLCLLLTAWMNAFVCGCFFCQPALPFPFLRHCWAVLCRVTDSSFSHKSHLCMTSTSPLLVHKEKLLWSNFVICCSWMFENAGMPFKKLSRVSSAEVT